MSVQNKRAHQFSMTKKFMKLQTIKYYKKEDPKFFQRTKQEPLP